MNEIWKNVVTAWENAGRSARLTLVTLIGGIIVVALLLAWWSMRTNYQVLFAELEPRDAAAIVDELHRMKVPYKLADGGNKILVAEDRVYDTRLSLMGKGVPLAGGIGFEIFDKNDVGMTEYTQKINYQRAMQGELARTIMAIDQVKQARVHLVVAESSIFKRQKVKPKASVSLVLKPGASLSNEQIVGIQRLVAAAVPSLEPAAVTVLDQRGVTLSAAIDGDEGFAAASGQLKLKKNAEEYFVRKISEVLDRTFGPGQAIVSVDVTLNFDEIKRTQQSIVPLRSGSAEVGAVVRKRESNYRQGYKAGGGDGAQGLTSTSEVEYEVGKSVEQVVTAPGGIRRVSVGIIVPKLNPQQIDRIHSVVSMIVGYSDARGDAIAIQPIDQLLSPVEEEVAAPTTPVDAANTNAGNGWSLLTRSSVIGAVVAALIGIALLIGWRLSQSRAQVLVGNGGLSDSERDARLVDIKAWLAAEKAKESR
ncbi:MAG: flagellar M-ring protein FliF [Gammaproteobacteria bacterium]|nr:flagellar M-ring protein FliF [Gammaproteobacteria bacterium]